MKLFVISTFNCNKLKHCLQHRLDDEASTEAISGSSRLSSMAGNLKRKRASSQSTLAGLRTSSHNLNTSYAVTGSRTLASKSRSGPSGSILSSAILGRTTSKPIILKSAFRPPIRKEQWTRDPPMIESLFIRTKATISTEGNVEISVSDGILEAIEIAGDWENGQTLYDQGKPHETTGFVGMGYSKRGVYVSSSCDRDSDLHTLTNIPLLGKIWWDRVCPNAALR